MAQYRKNIRRPWLLAGALALLTALAAWALVFRVNRFHLEVVLKGPDQIHLEYGQDYIEPGTDAVLRGTLFWRQGLALEQVEVSSDQQIGRELGRYSVDYQARFLFWQGQARRQVNVVDTQRPVITLEEDPEGALLPGRAYRERGFSAYDDHDGDITHLVRWEEGPGYIVYTVADSSGNPAQARRELPLLDTEPPQLVLEGGEYLSISVGSFYTEPGYTATDDWDGDLTEQVQVEGQVDWLTPGVYPITYTVQDAYENKTTAIRQVEVAAQPRPQVSWPGGKTIYLSFDDGPGPDTQRLLDILDRNGAKATFFVTDTGYDRAMSQIVERGHSIGIHTVSHNYAQIYASPEAYFQDLYQMRQVIYENTGVYTSLVRFPGGSSNTVSAGSYEGLMTLLTQAVQDAGFQYFDWNVDSGDASGAKKPEKIAQNVIDGVRGKQTALVLLHDIHGCTVDAVEEILRWGRENGYTFRPLEPTSPGFHHNVYN